MGIVVIGATLVDIKGYPYDQYNPTGRNAGRIIQVHGGVCRNIAEDIANVELRPVFVSLVDHSGLGEDCIRKLERHKVNVDYIRKTEDGLGTWLAIFDNSGDVAASISKRPDLREIGKILEEQGDEIFENADSICVEVDINVEILKQVLRLAQKYGKEVYAVISNMSLAVERRDLIQRTACFVCNQQEAGMFFSRDFEKLSPEELAPVLRRSSDKARIPRMVVTMGGRGSVYDRAVYQCGCNRHDRGRRRLLRRRCDRPDLWERPAAGLHDRYQNRGFCDRYQGKCLSQIPSGGIRDRDFRRR